MDRVSKLFLFMVSLLGIASCEEDVDGYTPGDFNYIIVNGTQHQIVITTDPISTDNKADTIRLSYQDSIVSKGYHVHWGDPEPFPAGRVFVNFDDSLIFKCQSNSECRCMINDPYFYEEVIVVPEKEYKYRYVITEEDYEYAKAHPYTGKR